MGHLPILRAHHKFGLGLTLGMEDGGGGGHTLQLVSLGTGDKYPLNTPQFSEFFAWGWEGAQKCFILGDQTTGDLKSHHLQARVTLTALSVPPGPHFLSAELQCHIKVIFPNYALPYILAISSNA